MSDQRLGRYDLDRVQRAALIIGAAGLLVCILGWILNPDQFYRSYLYGWLLWLGVALGSMGVIMMHHLTGGEWGLLIRRPGEAAALTLPLLAVLFIPIAIGVRHLYPWANGEELARDAIVHHRAGFFNIGAWLLRAAICFLAWIYLALRLRQLSVAFDRTGDPWIPRKMRLISAGGLVVYFVLMSIAAVDWILSREPHWYSTTFGLIVITGQAITGFTFLAVILALMSHWPPIAAVGRARHWHDLGNLLLTMVILWTYISFAQYLVIWLGNTQEDITWYVHRSAGFWGFIAILLIVAHFFVPFFMLLSQDIKRNLGRLAGLCGGIFILRVLDVLWMIEPSSLTERAHGLSWMDLFTPIGIGGIWLAGFLWLLRRQPVLPTRYRFVIEEAEEHGTHGATRPIA